MKDIINSKVVDKAYNDLGSPVLKELGSWGVNIVKAVRLTAFPIDLLAYGRDKLDRFLIKSLSEVQIEDRVKPQLEIVGPIIEGIKYENEDTILYNMFSKLMSSSIDKNNNFKSHPAFANIIKQLSPDEAVIMYYLNKKSYLIKQYSKYDYNKNMFFATKTLENNFPLDKLLYPENFFMYMNHINSLHLAGIWQDGRQEADFKEGKQIGVYIYSKTDLTEFGKMFVSACAPKEI